MFHLQAACLVLGLKAVSYGQEGKFSGEKHKVRHSLCNDFLSPENRHFFFFLYWRDPVGKHWR